MNAKSICLGRDSFALKGARTRRVIPRPVRLTVLTR